MHDQTDPFALFAAWLSEAREAEINDPTAMSLATVDETGLPDIRMVILNRADADGFAFFTNTESDKGQQMSVNPRAALGFHWKSLRRQVRIRGDVTHLSDEENDRWFERRPRDAQIGTWASRQSRAASSPDELARETARCEAEFEGGTVPRPPQWRGFRVIPNVIEFWSDQRNRMHDRRRFVRPSPGEPWTSERLFP